jgi:cyanophycinase
MLRRTLRFLPALLALALILALFPATLASAAAKPKPTPTPAPTSMPSATPTTAPAGSGKIMLLGGAIRNNDAEIFNAMRAASPGPKLAVFCSGTTDIVSAQKEYASAYENLFTSYGFTPVFIPVAIDNWQDASYAAANIALVDGCDAAFFNGGWQERHTRVMFEDGGTPTPLMLAVQRLFDRGGLVSGTSAGDNVMGEYTYGDGTSYGYLKHNALAVKSIADVNTADPTDPDNGGYVKGLGFLARYDALADSHFSQRGRFARPLVAMRDTGTTRAFGVDEDTAFLLAGTTGTVYGTGGVTVYDATAADFGKSADEAPGTSFTVSNVRVSWLTSGDRYDFTANAVVPGAGKTTAPTTGKVYASTNVFGAGEATKVMTLLGLCAATSATGLSAETAPQFTVTFAKGTGTKAYYNAKTRRTAIDGQVVGIAYK